MVKFVMFADRERVRKSSKKLKGSPFGIFEQFPKEIVEARRKLIPELKKARVENKEAYINVDNVDKLFINGREFKPDN